MEYHHTISAVFCQPILFRFWAFCGSFFMPKFPNNTRRVCHMAHPSFDVHAIVVYEQATGMNVGTIFHRPCREILQLILYSAKGCVLKRTLFSFTQKGPECVFPPGRQWFPGTGTLRIPRFSDPFLCGSATAYPDYPE